MADSYVIQSAASAQLLIQEKTKELMQNYINSKPQVAHAADECSGLYDWCRGSGEYSVFFCMGAYAYCLATPQVQMVHVQEKAQESVQNDIKSGPEVAASNSVTCSNLYSFCRESGSYSIFFCMGAYAYCLATPQVQMVHVHKKAQESVQNGVKSEPLQVVHAADECSGLYE